MKTILVPTENTTETTPALQVAVLLARRCGAYIEGFPLRFALPPYVVAEMTVGFTLNDYAVQRDEDVAELRRMFEAFMHDHGIPPSDTTTERPAFGWLASTPEDDSFVGSYGRAFDVISDTTY